MKWFTEQTKTTQWLLLVAVIIFSFLVGYNSALIVTYKIIGG